MLDGVGNFLQIDLADDVETVFRHVGGALLKL
jgi:hypothetical protein